MLGITLTPPSGQALAEYLVTGRRPAVLEPFRSDRFA
jgi:glycine/D-amino acid oxidase-like deaminating enzyme